MRSRPLWLISFALTLLPGGLTSSPSARASRSGSDFATVDDYVTRRMRSAQLPGLAVAIVKGDRILYAKGFGRADPSGRAVTPQTPFIIGSVSKAFTALAVMQLVEAGKVQLDAPVQRYVPWFRVADSQASSEITVRELLYQTSGMPQPPASQAIAGDDDRALERALRALANLDLVGPPGRSFAYSNGNYDTLGMIVQTVSGESYEQYVREHIFAPLDMRNSYVSQDEAIQHGMASGYRWWFGIPVAATLPYVRADLPAGYVISSAEDMAHFLIAEMNGGRYENSSLLSAGGIATTHVMPATPYGMGWESVVVDGHTLIDHDGGTPNFQASLFFDPKERVGVFIVANACGVLDAFTSPPGSDPRDGPTLRAMAQTVLSLTTGRPVPPQGIGHATMYGIYVVVILSLTGALVVSLVRIPKWLRRVERRGISSAAVFARRSAVIAVVHFALPAAMLILALGVPAWRVLVALYQPDLAYWLEAVAVVLYFKGLLELTLVYRVFAETREVRVPRAA